MPTVKRIVCLANSRKLGGHCVAGKTIVGTATPTWVRPITTTPGGALSLLDMICHPIGVPVVLDIVDVPMLQAAPHDYQQENWRIAGGRWQKHGQAGWSDLLNLADPIAPLWHDGNHTQPGLNDAIPLPTAKTLSSSLRLVHVPSLVLHVVLYGAGYPDAKRRVQGRFEHAGTRYWLWVTDPVYEQRYRALPDGQYQLGESYLTVSIGEPYEKQQACYKLIAAIIERNPGAHP